MIRIIRFILFCLSTICTAELRTWTAVNGNKVEANYISSSKGIVKLRLKSGKLFEVPKNKLSKDDNEFIDSLFKKEVVVGSGVRKNLSRAVNGDKIEITNKQDKTFKSKQENGVFSKEIVELTKDKDGAFVVDNTGTYKSTPLQAVIDTGRRILIESTDGKVSTNKNLLVKNEYYPKVSKILKDSKMKEMEGKFKTSPINAFLLGPIKIGKPKSLKSLSLFKIVKL